MRSKKVPKPVVFHQIRFEYITEGEFKDSKYPVQMVDEHTSTPMTTDELNTLWTQLMFLHEYAMDMPYGDFHPSTDSFRSPLDETWKR